MINNARGFVENVKNNLRIMVLNYFNEPSASRDAFLERIGRDLTTFGWELTDGADGALYSRGAALPDTHRIQTPTLDGNNRPERHAADPRAERGPHDRGAEVRESGERSTERGRWQPSDPPPREDRRRVSAIMD